MRPDGLSSVLHVLIAIGVMVIGVATGRADTPEFALLKSLWISAPSNIIISFTYTNKLLGWPEGGIVATDRLGGVLRVPTHARFYCSYTHLGEDVTLARSMAPLVAGFQLGTGFSAAGIFKGTNWTLSAAGQLHRALVPTPLSSKGIGGEARGLSSGFPEVAALLTLGVDLRPGSVFWHQDEFRGVTRTQADPHSRGTQGRPVQGRIFLANGLPVHISYRVGGVRRVELTYSYTQSFELPFPSEISSESFTIHPDGHETADRVDAFELADARTTPSEADLDRLAPRYFAKSGQPIREFLVKDGVTVAGMPNGTWVFDEGSLQTHSKARVVLVLLLSVVSLTPIVLAGWRRARARGGQQDRNA